MPITKKKRRTKTNLKTTINLKGTLLSKSEVDSAIQAVFMRRVPWLPPKDMGTVLIRTNETKVTK